MLRVVPDINVIISGVITPSGYPGRLYAAWKRRRLFFITSPVIIAKVVEVLRRPHIAERFSLDEAEMSAVRSLLDKRTIRTPHLLDLHVVEQDPEDDTILIAAVEGRADFIVSGDKHLKKLESYQGIPILSPAKFVIQHKIP